MSPTVRVDDATMERLEGLQADIKRETGQRVTRQAIVEHLVEEATESELAVVQAFE